MTMHWTMGTRFTCWVPADPEVVRDRLATAIEGEFRGTVDDRGFRVSRRLARRNSWRPRLSGTLRAAAGGTLVEVEVGVEPLVYGFTLLHGALFLGLTWAVGVSAFSWEVEEACDVLAEVLGATLRGERALAVLEPGDPKLPGAEANAPVPLHARVGDRGVRFRLEDTHALVEIEVDAVDVELREREKQVRIAWDDLAACTYDRARRSLALTADGRAHTFSCPGASERDGEWLAAYLLAQAERRRLPPEERERQDRERERLEQLAGQVRGDHSGAE